MLGYPLRFCSGGAWPKIITLADICKPLLCARCGSHEYDMHFLHPYPIRMQILLLSPMFKWRNQDLGGLISLPEVTQIISMGTKSLMPVGHSDSRDRLNVSVHLQAHMCTGLGVGQWWKWRIFCLPHICLKLCWDFCDSMEKNQICI